MIQNSKFNQNSKLKIQNFKLQSFPKILIIFFLSVFILQIICLFFLLTAPTAGQAADLKFTPQVEIPGYTFNAADKTTRNIGNLIRAIYNYAIGIIGILAAVVLMVGGVLWIIAGGNATQIGEAKAWIGASLTGLIIALSSYLILNQVNPALINLNTPAIQPVSEIKIGSCTTVEVAKPGENPCKDNYTEEQCKKVTGEFVKNGKCPKSCCEYQVQSTKTSIKICELEIPETVCNSKFLPVYKAKGKCENNQCVAAGGATGSW